MRSRRNGLMTSSGGLPNLSSKGGEIMDAIAIFVPFIVAFGVALYYDPLTQKFLDDWMEGR